MKILHSFHSAHSQLLVTYFVGDVNIIYYVSVLMHIFLTSCSTLNHLNDKYYHNLFVLRVLNLWEVINSFQTMRLLNMSDPTHCGLKTVLYCIPCREICCNSACYNLILFLLLYILEKISVFDQIYCLMQIYLMEIYRI